MLLSNIRFIYLLRKLLGNKNVALSEQYKFKSDESDLFFTWKIRVGGAPRIVSTPGWPPRVLLLAFSITV